MGGRDLDPYSECHMSNRPRSASPHDGAPITARDHGNVRTKMECNANTTVLATPETWSLYSSVFRPGSQLHKPRARSK